MTYGASAWWPCAKYARNMVENCQKIMLRMYCNDFKATYPELINMAQKVPNPHVSKWETLSSRITRGDLGLFHKYYHRQRHGPDKLVNRPPDNARRSQRTNNSCAVEMTSNSDSTATWSTMLLRSARIWNALPNTVVHLPYPKFVSDLGKNLTTLNYELFKDYETDI